MHGLLLDHESVVMHGIQTAVNREVASGMSLLNWQFSAAKTDLQKSCDALKKDITTAACRFEAQGGVHFAHSISNWREKLRKQIQTDLELSKKECVDFFSQQFSQQTAPRTSVFLQTDLDERFRIFSQEINQRQTAFLTQDQIAGAFNQIVEKCKETMLQNQNLRTEMHHLHSEVAALKRFLQACPAGTPQPPPAAPPVQAAAPAAWSAWGGGDSLGLGKCGGRSTSITFNPGGRGLFSF